MKKNLNKINTNKELHNITLNANHIKSIQHNIFTYTINYITLILHNIILLITIFILYV